MSASRRDVLDIGAAGLRHLAGALTGLITIPVVAYGLGVEALGAWALLGAAYAIVGLGDAGMAVPVQRAAVKGERSKARRTLALALLVGLVVTPLLSALTFFALTTMPAIRDVDTAELATGLVVFAGATSALTAPYRGFVLARGGVRGLAVARVAAAVLQIGTMFAALTIARDLSAPALGLAVGALLEGAAVVALARGFDPGVPLRPSAPCRRELREALRDAAASLTINLATTATTRIDVFVLAQVAPLRVVAAYGVASRVVDQAFLLAKQVGTALLPRLGAAAQRADAIRFGTGVLGGLVASGMIALTFAGGGWLRAWAGPVTGDALFGPVLALLAVAAIVTASQEIAASALTLGARSAWSAAGPISAGASLNLALTVVFASSGAIAIAAATVAGAALTATLIWRRTRRLLEWSPSCVLRTLAPAVGAGLVSLGGGVLVSTVAATGILPSVLACAAVTSMGCGAAVLTAKGLDR